MSAAARLPLRRHSTEWFAALDAFVAERQRMPFAWGSNDCCTFAADWIERARGRDPMADVRGRYADRLQAARLARELGPGFDLGNLHAAASGRLGEALHGWLAQAGDVVLVRHEGMCAMGVCLGARVAVVTPAGLAHVSIETAEAAWRV